jgi:hypothetical protein
MARQLIESSALEPRAMATALQAFDLAWSEIADSAGNDASDIEEAQRALAHACLLVSHEGCDDPERIKLDALQVMGIAYRQRL